MNECFGAAIGQINSKKIVATKKR